MKQQFLLLQLINFGLLIKMEIFSAQSHHYVLVKVNDQVPIKWLSSSYGHETLCFTKCIWTNCPGFKWENQTCSLMESNQTLPIATQASGTEVFVQEEFIQNVESSLVYNTDTVYEFIPQDSPLKGFPMTFPDPPIKANRILMDFPWGFHLCYPVKTTCYRWYFGTDEWIPMPDMLFPHAMVQDMIRINKTWWILGGFWKWQGPKSNINPHRISEHMDESGHWHQGSNYLFRHIEGLATISDTSVLAVGGTHTPNRAESAIVLVTEFDIKRGPIKHRFYMTCPIFGTACSSYLTRNGTKMFLCVGGHCPTDESPLRSEVFSYNLETGDWMKMPEWEFPETIRFANLVRFQGNLYVVGARYGQSDRNTVYEFDETKQPVWTIIDMLPDHANEYSRIRTFSRSLIVV